MEAAYISYAIFLALLLLAVIVIIIIVSVRSLLAYIRGRNATDEHKSGR